jgi:hypothetical protein
MFCRSTVVVDFSLLFSNIRHAMPLVPPQHEFAVVPLEGSEDVGWEAHIVAEWNRPKKRKKH